MYEKVDLYCERTGPEFWAEPLGAWSNLAFLLSAMLILNMWRRKTPNDSISLFFIMLVFAQGVGSFLFHTLSTRWAGIADALPIVTFIVVYLTVALRRFLELGWLACAAILLVFVAVVPIVGRALSPAIGSTAVYMPALFAAFLVGFFYFPKNRELAIGIFAAGCVFALSLTFRILDLPLCGVVPTGTHFLWHIFNAIAVYMLLRVLIWQRAGYTGEEIEVG